jgi:hypothetical protein
MIYDIYKAVPGHLHDLYESLLIGVVLYLNVISLVAWVRFFTVAYSHWCNF